MRGHLWRESLSCAALIPLEEAEIKAAGESLYDDMIESKDYSSAAAIQLDYMDNVELAVQLLCKATMYSSAIQVATSRFQLRLLETTIDPSLVEGSAAMTELISEFKGQVKAQTARIIELRKKEHDHQSESRSLVMPPI